jgi:hypothetical protein
MQKIDNPEERTVGRNGGTHASAVSKMLMNMGYTKFHQYDTDRGGYYCSNWGTDSQNGTMVKVEFRRPGRGLKGKSSEHTVNRVRRNKLTEMARGLRTMGYYVEWGWDEESGEPDTTFLVVSVNPARVGDVTLAGDEQVQAAPAIPQDVLEPLRIFLISIQQVEETVQEISRAHNAGKDDVARRMEHTLYQKVLLAIVGKSTDDPLALAAAALATQHLSFPR